MKYTIRGTTLQVADMQLGQGESVYTEKGGMSWMSANISMKTNARGGFFSGIGRMFAGESFFLTNYECTEGTGIITFASEYPGKIIAFNLKASESLICQKDSFMCAENSVNLSMHFRKKLGAGFFGGEGFILEKISGPGLAFVEIAGEVTEYKLGAGQVLKIDPGHLAIFEPSVNYDISRVKGLKNIFFGGEGLFLATVTGPGKVWLQSMPLSNLAKKLGIAQQKPGFVSNIFNFLK